MLTVASMFATSSLFAQNKTLERYFDRYQEDQRFTTVSVSSRMFGLFADFDMDDPEEAELVEAISKLKGLKMLIGEQVDNATALFEEAQKENESSMEELMSVRDGGNEFVFYVKETGGTISELMMIGHEQSQFMMMSLTGEIDLAMLSRLSQKMDIEGFEHLKNVGH